MKKLAIFLSLATLSLFFSTSLFNGKQYFSFAASLGLIVLGGLAAVMFVAPYTTKEQGWRKERILIGVAALSTALIICEYVFAYTNPIALASVNQRNGAATLITACLSAAISLSGIYFVSKFAEGRNRKVTYALIIAGAVFIAFIVYFLVVGRGYGTGASDELAFNYYASQLFLRGQNPYTTSMQPALSMYYSARPTIRLNGSIEDAYVYPAFSFISLAPISVFEPHSISAAYWLTILLSVCSAFIVFIAAGRKVEVLLPIGVWLTINFYFITTFVEPIAISVLLLLAYLNRKNVLRAGVLAGFAAGTTQLAWFGIPFLLVLVLREQGRGQFSRLLAAAILTFLVLNSYYLIASPRAVLSDLIGTFAGLTVNGTTLVQLLVSFYPVAYSYALFLFVSSFALLLLLFYLHTETLKPLAAVAPFAIFFLAWRNLVTYGMPFVPVLIALRYAHDGTGCEDIKKYDKWFVPAFVAFVLISAVLLVYAHASYERSNTLKINSAALTALALKNGSEANYVIINISNDANTERNVSVYIYSINPSLFITVPGYMGHSGVPAESYALFADAYPLGVENNTRLFILAFANGSITSKHIDGK